MDPQIMEQKTRETISLVWEGKDREGFINDIKSMKVQRIEIKSEIYVGY